MRTSFYTKKHKFSTAGTRRETEIWLERDFKVRERKCKHIGGVWQTQHLWISPTLKCWGFFNHSPALQKMQLFWYPILVYDTVEKGKTHIYILDYMVNALYKLSFMKCHRLAQVSIIHFDSLVLTFTAFPMCQFIYGSQFQRCLQHINSLFLKLHTRPSVRFPLRLS